MRQQPSAHINIPTTRRAAVKLRGKSIFFTPALLFRDRIRLTSLRSTDRRLSLPQLVLFAQVPLLYLVIASLARTASAISLRAGAARAEHGERTLGEFSPALVGHAVPFPSRSLSRSAVASFSTSHLGCSSSSARRTWRGACQASFR